KHKRSNSRVRRTSARNSGCKNGALAEQGITERELRILRRYLKCILNGGVYLRHRLKDSLLPFLPPKYSTTTQRRARLAFRRAGVQETVRFHTQDVRFVSRQIATY